MINIPVRFDRNWIFAIEASHSTCLVCSTKDRTHVYVTWRTKIKSTDYESSSPSLFWRLFPPLEERVIIRFSWSYPVWQQSCSEMSITSTWLRSEFIFERKLTSCMSVGDSYRSQIPANPVTNVLLLSISCCRWRRHHQEWDETEQYRCHQWCFESRKQALNGIPSHRHKTTTYIPLNSKLASISLQQRIRTYPSERIPHFYSLHENLPLERRDLLTCMNSFAEDLYAPMHSIKWIRTCIGVHK
jgi:hypothetical protein